MKLDQAMTFWDALFEGHVAESRLVEGRAIHPSNERKPNTSFFTKREEMLAWAESKLQAGYNVYAGVNLRDGKGGKKDNITAINALHADIDFQVNGQDANKPTPEEARDLLQNFELPPTVVVHSGGGLHLYWKLIEPLTNPTQFNLVESINQELAMSLRGDKGVKNIDRILRIPGTKNFKQTQAREVVLETSDGPVYAFNDLEVWFDHQSQNQPHHTQDNDNIVPSQKKLFTSDELKSMGFSEASVLRITSGVWSDFPSRSERDQTVLFDAAKNKVPYQDILRIFDAMPIGDKFRDEKDPNGYLMRSYEKALEYMQSKDRASYANPGVSSRRSKGVDLLLLLQRLRLQNHLRFCPSQGAPYRFTGKGYQPLNKAEFNRLCQELLGASRVYFKRGMVDDLYHLLEGEGEIHIDASALQSPKYLAFQNGLMNLDDLSFQNHTPNIITTTVLPYAYDPDSDCPRFRLFLEEIFERDQERIHFIKESMGYALHPYLPVPGLFYFYGNGANGKSVLLSVIKAMVGEENAVSLNLKQLLDERYIVKLAGKRVNIVDENPNIFCQDTALLKAIVAGSEVTGRGIYQEPMTFNPICKHFLAVNSPPIFKEKTEAIRRRVQVVAFTRIFNREEQDIYLLSKLVKELPGIFNFAMEGLKRLKARDFRFTAMRNAEVHNDPVKKALQAFRQTFEYTEDEDMKFKALFEFYQQFCLKEEVNNLLKKHEFKERLVDMGLVVERSSRHQNQVRIMRPKSSR